MKFANTSPLAFRVAAREVRGSWTFPSPNSLARGSRDARVSLFVKD